MRRVWVLGRQVSDLIDTPPLHQLPFPRIQTMATPAEVAERLEQDLSTPDNLVNLVNPVKTKMTSAHLVYHTTMSISSAPSGPGLERFAQTPEVVRLAVVVTGQGTKVQHVLAAVHGLSVDLLESERGHETEIGRVVVLETFNIHRKPSKIAACGMYIFYIVLVRKWWRKMKENPPVQMNWRIT